MVLRAYIFSSLSYFWLLPKLFGLAICSGGVGGMRLECGVRDVPKIMKNCHKRVKLTCEIYKLNGEK